MGRRKFLITQGDLRSLCCFQVDGTACQKTLKMLLKENYPTYVGRWSSIFIFGKFEPSAPQHASLKGFAGTRAKTHKLCRSMQTSAQVDGWSHKFMRKGEKNYIFYNSLTVN